MSLIPRASASNNGPDPRVDLPYNFLALAKDAELLLSVSREAVLASALRLYESGFITYPKTDCQYLPAYDREAMLSVLEKIPRELTNEDASAVGLREVVFDSYKLTEHHAIVPTGKNGTVPMADRALYHLIVWRFARTVFA